MNKIFQRSVQLLLAIIVAVFANGVMPAAAAYAYSSTNPSGEYKKVYVCKYVGTPGVDERLQTGNNPISVDTSALKNFNGLGSYFNDKQEKSVAIAWDNKDKIEPSIDLCPAPVGPPTEITVPVVPVNDPCGPRNASYGTVPEGNYTYEVNKNGSITFTALSGYTFAKGKTTATIPAPTDSNIACEEEKEEVTPEAPSVNDECDTKNDYLTIPKQEGVIYTINDKKVKAGELNVKAGEHTVVAVAAKGYVLVGETSWTFETTDEDCPKVTICHRTASQVNPYVQITVDQDAVDGDDGNDNGNGDHFLEHTGPVYPATGEDGKWGDIIPAIEDVHDGLNWDEAGQAIYDNDCNYAVAPEAPSFYDVCGPQFDDYVNIPETTGITYYINGVEADSGYQAVEANEVTVTAVAQEGFTIPRDADTEWSFTYTDEECLTITKEALPLTDTNGDGKIGLGDTVTWKITVTNNSDNEYEDFYVEVFDDMAVIEGDNYVKSLAPGESHVFMATSQIGAEQVKACKATNTASYQAWFSNRELDRSVNSIVIDEEPAYDLSGSADASIGFSCPTTPQILSTTTPVTIPATIPATGGQSTSLYIVVLAVMTYLAAYAAQGRRRAYQQ